MVKGSVPSIFLLEWDIWDGRGPLCAFLDRQELEEEFSSDTNLQGFDSRVDKLLGDCQRRAGRNLLVTAASVAILLFVGLRVAKEFRVVRV